MPEPILPSVPAVIKTEASNNSVLINNQVKLASPLFEAAVSIKIFGIGGAGGNILDHLIRSGFPATRAYALNTDRAHLSRSLASNQLLIGKGVTAGLGTGKNPQRGLLAAQESEGIITEALAGADLVFLIGGLGKGTGAGALPFVAELAKKQKVMSFAIVATPFHFEGATAQKIAAEALREIELAASATMTLSNEKIRFQAGNDATDLAAFRLASESIYEVVVGIHELLAGEANINVDFSDFASYISGSKRALVARKSVPKDGDLLKAIGGMLTNDAFSVSLMGSPKSIIFFTYAQPLAMTTIEDAINLLKQRSGNMEHDVIYGIRQDLSLASGEIQICIVSACQSEAQATIAGLAKNNGPNFSTPAPFSRSALFNRRSERHEPSTNLIRQPTILETGVKMFKKQTTSAEVIAPGVHELRRFEDVKAAANELLSASGRVVIVDLNRLPAELKNRVADFLNGLIYALRGSVEQITPERYSYTNPKRNTNAASTLSVGSAAALITLGATGTLTPSQLTDQAKLDKIDFSKPYRTAAEKMLGTNQNVFADIGNAEVRKHASSTPVLNLDGTNTQYRSVFTLHLNDAERTVTVLISLSQELTDQQFLDQQPNPFPELDLATPARPNLTAGTSGTINFVLALAADIGPNGTQLVATRPIVIQITVRPLDEVDLGNILNN
ncbi:unnamed protein product [Didymodactylos carnosus]|uniref:Tubulin/FtsZ GTPase domain-containing protein n=1 Tax=Didymodactylos carnosus TaxID=1234261 RepID=A0A8S2GIW0_9BILA|nr:unnamed protein product [Didymodactylos carnosus]CAF3523887.1 unnamed protein product [Didymodactylos carnosus]